ncbi:hypothetical protein QUF54_01005 [Candidatus Marithioploca araucensis]|uniref:50S ribosomal protein L33 n=1 Tax=Candidatus Marithioploca araucensis TaxID=70273 RepID=A0ABT7VQI4_9GAMM|nr:hypothetical protein [Candidatus Marithioploca araucensis]
MPTIKKIAVVNPKCGQTKRRLPTLPGFTNNYWHVITYWKHHRK